LRAVSIIEKEKRKLTISKYPSLCKKEREKRQRDGGEQALTRGEKMALRKGFTAQINRIPDWEPQQDKVAKEGGS